MSGWTKVKYGDVEFIHHSTSSVIEFILREDGDVVKVYLDYYQFESLKQAIKQIDTLSGIKSQ